MTVSIMALDLATTTGWAIGKPGSAPLHGSVKFGASSHEATFAKAFEWMTEKCVFHRPQIVIWEAPLATMFRRGKTTVNTTTVLYGLPAVIGAAAYRRGIYDLRKADTKDVRQHFIGSNPKREKAKPMVVKQCQRLGWQVTDDNEADALATWHYMCSLIEPKLAMSPTPLFLARA